MPEPTSDRVPEQSPITPSGAAPVHQPEPSWFDSRFEKVGSWIFQALIAVVAFFLAHQFNSIQSDLKELRKDVEAVRLTQAAQQGQDLRSRVQQLEADLRTIEQRLLWRSTAGMSPMSPDPMTTPSAIPPIDTPR